MYGQQSPASVKQCAWIWERPKAVPAASEVNGASRTANPRVDCETTSNTAAVSPRVVQKRRDAFASLLATGQAHHANPPTGVTNKLAIGKTKCQSFVMCVRNYGVPNSVVGQKDSSQTQAVQSVLLTYRYIWYSWCLKSKTRVSSESLLAMRRREGVTSCTRV